MEVTFNHLGHKYKLVASTGNMHIVSRDSLIYLCVRRAEDDGINLFRDTKVKDDRKFLRIMHSQTRFDSITTELLHKIIKVGAEA